MKNKERVLRRLNGQEVDMTPCGCTTAYAMLELMRRCGYERPLADTDPVAMAALSMAGYTEAGFDWVKAMGWDITAVSQAMGSILGEPKIDRPYFIAVHPFAERDVMELDCPADLLTQGRFPAFKEQFRILKEKLGDEAAVFGMSEGPFTCAASLLGISRLLRATIREPEIVEKALEVTEHAIIKVINFAFSQGADYFCLADPTSSSDLLNPKSWSKFVGPVMSRVVKAATGPIVLHVCGNVDILIPDMCDTGVAGISIEEKTDLKAALITARAKGVKVFGNVSSSSSLFMGAPETCYKEARDALECGVDFLAPGCGIAPHSPLENVLQLRKARDDYFMKR